MENVCHKVEFQLDLYSGDINYQDLFKHLSVAFQGGNDKANLLVEFYNYSQKAKETEEAFTDELQILARKVISKNLIFRSTLTLL